jgi:hypothetical protein
VADAGFKIANYQGSSALASHHAVVKITFPSLLPTTKTDRPAAISPVGAFSPEEGLPPVLPVKL